MGVQLGEKCMKKLLFVISQLYKGGAETSLVNLLNNLDYSKYSVDLLILNQSPVENGVSLIDRVNKKVTVCDAYAEYQKINILDRVRAKFFYTMPQKGAYYITALDFVRNKIYDWAFFVGEWCSPSFVAKEVEAKIKAAWIHTDLSKAKNFDKEHYFYFADLFDYFIFVSKKSLETSVEKYPFLTSKAVVIYNISDINYIHKRAEEPVKDKLKEKAPVLLTCANVRPEKNHIRQVEVMAELKKRGLIFTWANIGSTADKTLVSKVKNLCKTNGLENNFLILGSKENPYSYIKQADAVTVLSDYESWSMVITEAKILGKPVIATKTSGALEQICDGETGLLTDFTVKDIADKIESFLRNPLIKEKIQNNLSNFDNTEEILQSFDRLIETGKSSKEYADILYVIDDINYMSGAHIATKLQIKSFVQQGKKILVYSSCVPNLKTRLELPMVNFLTFADFKEDILFNRRLLYCLFDNRLTRQEKKNKLKNSVNSYRKKFNYERDVLPYISRLFSKYSVVCVMSESSAYRKAVALSSCKNKIQWIHTDYCEWRKKSDWTKSITANDGKIYNKFNTIVCLTENIRNKFVKLYPHLDSKTIVNKNLMPVEEIKKKSQPIVYKNEIPVNFITVGRIGAEKQFPMLIKILAELKQSGYRFTWKIVGDGEEFHYVKELVNQMNLEKEVIMTGALENPFREVIKADIFALLSSYEGIPNTIYEAFILGVPVLATNVGGIPTQVTDGKNGWLVENDEDKILQKIKFLLTHPDKITVAKEYLKTYKYENDAIMNINNKIFHT